MRHICQYKPCSSEFDAKREDAKFCSAKCNVYASREAKKGGEVSPPAEPKKAPKKVEAAKPVSIPSPKADPKMDRVRAIVEKVCAGKTPAPRPVWNRDENGPKPWPDLEDVRFRLFGGEIHSLKSIFGESKFGGIKEYNRTQLRQCQPWHCTTVSRLTELFLSWGCQPLKHLKEIAEVGYLPDPSEEEALP